MIPTGNNKEDFRAREALITLFYVEWNHNNPEHRVFNDDLNDYIYVTYLSLDETRRHAAKRRIRKISQKCLEWNANWKI